MSIREDAQNGIVTPLFETCARKESLPVEQLMAGVAQGTIAITKNHHHDFEKIIAIGKNTSTKVNANIGSSRDIASLEEELEKLRVAVKAGSDTVMDLSMGGDLDAVTGYPGQLSDSIRNRAYLSGCGRGGGTG